VVMPVSIPGWRSRRTARLPHGECKRELRCGRAHEPY
jgi:hypothetical protein